MIVVKVFLLALALAPVAGATEPAPAAESAPAEVAPIEVIVRGGRYEPAEIVVKAGEPVKLRFVRQEWNSCTQHVVFPTLDLRRELPPEQPVIVDLPALPAGETPFRCGMGMVHGKIVAR